LPMFYISGHMETFDSVHSFREDDVQLDSLLDDVSTLHARTVGTKLQPAGRHAAGRHE